MPRFASKHVRKEVTDVFRGSVIGALAVLGISQRALAKKARRVT